MTVTQKPFDFSVPAKGELVSAAESPVNAPSGNRGRLTLAWMAEENSSVKKGDIIARFDGTEHELEKQRAELELTQNELSQTITSRELNQNQFAIAQQAGEVKQEKEMVEKFSVDDLTVYSKNEIIDQLLSKDYLTAQQLYLAWREVSQQTQGQAQLQLLTLEGKSYRDAISLNAQALNNLEVAAPADGIFVHAKNWRGEKVREGQTLWPGSKLGYIPSLTQLQAKLYVLETEAAGIEMGQRASIRLDAYADQPLGGEIVALANIAAPRDTRSPTKYFEVTVQLDTSDPSFMRPGQKLEGKILVANKEAALAVPNQAVFKDNDNSWVYVASGASFARREVKTGLRSLTQTEIIDGLRVGEKVALLEPTGEIK
ncbi:efflux RND transporter periplasmic adaptor subunit [Gilvimarinus sp. DA14]|uniref:efflux RND transporter periplasmic adaptor subunit n=1 Tax=Gilvimarinus sp. DA14 TaxID=2956798 RepID=UPI0020B6CC45|nr:efflux RND transporter periplasmic adaptor subunit [Gilvimarinus sp. DA14]UTF59319.1 efflux RND transporter periplasmic adaptor subunit [Gilvimarinus sp. DA14]